MFGTSQCAKASGNGIMRVHHQDIAPPLFPRFLSSPLALNARFSGVMVELMFVRHLAQLLDGTWNWKEELATTYKQLASLLQ